MNFSGLRPNLDKCEKAGKRVLKNLNMALCGMKNINPTKENIKILGVRISYNKKIQDDLNFCKTIKKYLYCYKALTYEKIINNLKNCTLSYNNKVSNIAIGELKQIQKTFRGITKK